jgi:hypothetical protein
MIFTNETWGENHQRALHACSFCAAEDFRPRGVRDRGGGRECCMFRSPATHRNCSCAALRKSPTPIQLVRFAWPFSRSNRFARIPGPLQILPALSRSLKAPIQIYRSRCDHDSRILVAYGRTTNNNCNCDTTMILFHDKNYLRISTGKWIFANF